MSEPTTRPYPTELPLRTVNDPLPVGSRRGGVGAFSSVAATVRVRDNVLITGAVRSGGTNLLLDIYAGLRQCTDAVPWVIDLYGGGLSVLNRLTEANAPLADWVATTDDEAERMLTAAQRIITARQVEYLADDHTVDGSMRVHADMPAIVMLVDVMLSQGNTEPVRRLHQIAATGAPVGVHVVLYTRRATADMVSPGDRGSYGVHIAMRPADPNDLAYQFGHGQIPAEVAGQLDRPGAGLYLSEAGTPVVFDAYTIQWLRIQHIHTETVARQAPLDETSRTAAGAEYARRWAAHATVDRELLFSEIVAARTAGQRVDDLVEVHQQARGYADRDAIVEMLEKAVAAGELTRHPLGGRYFDAHPIPRELGSLALPVSADILAAFTSVLNNAVGGGLTSDHIEFVGTGTNRRVVVYDAPLHTPR